MTHAATNLAFIHYNEQDLVNSERYCDLALNYD